MGAKQELWEYFMNHTSGRRSLKGAVHGIIAFTMDADDEIIDLILKRLKRSEITFVESSGAYFDYSRKELHFPYKITPSHRSTALHEMGHAVDFISCECTKERVNEHRTRTVYKEHCCSVEKKLTGGKTLAEIVRAELKQKSAEIYDFLQGQFKCEVLDKLGEDTAVKFLSANERLTKDDELKIKHRVPRFTLDEYKSDRARIDELCRIRDSLTLSYDERFNLFEVRKGVTGSSEYRKFQEKYDILLDMISGVYNTKYLWCGHSRSYMKRKGGFGVEFFADVFSAIATRNEENLCSASKLLHKSYAAYEEVFEYLKSAE